MGDRARIGWQEIKDLSTDLNRPIKTLIALSGHHDPFYIGPANRREGEWLAALYHEHGFRVGVHLRRIHYRLVSHESPVLDWRGRPYENTLGCWNILCEASMCARYLGLIPIEDFVDRRNPDPVIHLAETPSEPGFEIVDFPELRLSGGFALPPSLSCLEFPEFRLPALGDLEAPDPVQPYHIEIWCEKTTVSDILDRIAWRYRLNVVYGMGELSLTACLALMRRIEANGGRRVRLLYVSDFDPSGLSMPVAVARKIEWLIRCKNPEIDLQLRPILLNLDQCAEYRLPRSPIKDSDLRGARFESRFGEGATELDALEALHPGELRRIVEREIERYYEDGDALQARWDEIVADTNEVLAEATETALADNADAIEQIVTEHQAIADAARAFRRQAADAIAPIIAEYQAVSEAARALSALAASAVEPILAQYRAHVVEAANALRERAEPVFAKVADDLRERAEEIVAGMETIGPAGDEDENPLFDSSRDYVEQIDNYKKFQGKETKRKRRSSCAVKIGCAP